MKSIAVTIDEESLRGLDRLVRRRLPYAKSRSEVVRRAIQQYLTLTERLTAQDRERKILQQHRKRLNQQATALVKEQAKL
jgi:metal-responsive CopG/Arc/MetJ family transcriptional regulator